MSATLGSEVRPDGSVFWTDGQPRRARATAPPGRCDVAIVGAGYTGLWTAIALLERDPTLRVALLDSARVGDGPSGRNGGWLEPSLTHGIATGESRFGQEMGELEQIARENGQQIAALIDRLGFDVDFEPVGTLEIAVAEHQLKALEELADGYRRHDWPAQWLEGDALRDALNTPKALAGVRAPTRGGLLDPYKLVQALADHAEALGATIHEHQRVVALREILAGARLRTADGHLDSDQVVLAVDGGLRDLLPGRRRLTAPLVDYVMVSEPLGARLEEIGWSGREGVADLAGAFSSFRLTAESRLYWGGSEAVYRYGSRPPGAPRPAAWARLAVAAESYLPALAGIRWTHRWTGTIPMTSSAMPAFGTALGGRAHWVTGFTGLGVASSRVAGRVLAARVQEHPDPLLELAWSRHRPLPLPPEPLRWAGIELTRRHLVRADRTGRRSLLLRSLDRLGVGLTS